MGRIGDVAKEAVGILQTEGVVAYTEFLFNKGMYGYPWMRDMLHDALMKELQDAKVF